jgi:hypothetical protein
MARYAEWTFSFQYLLADRPKAREGGSRMRSRKNELLDGRKIIDLTRHRKAKKRTGLSRMPPEDSLRGTDVARGPFFAAARRFFNPGRPGTSEQMQDLFRMYETANGFGDWVRVFQAASGEAWPEAERRKHVTNDAIAEEAFDRLLAIAVPLSEWRWADRSSLPGRFQELARKRIGELSGFRG